MTITIENYKRSTTPAYGDHVIFSLNGKKLDYQVCSSHLSSCTSGIPNDGIFDELHLNKVVFCERAYGYSQYGDGIFPQCKNEDYSALKRVIDALFHKIEETFSEQVITIDNYKSIPCIKLGDKITFDVNGEIIDYKVQNCFLEEALYRNSLIFTKLGLDKKFFCTNAYGYEAAGGSFPESKSYDLEALHRVVNALFDHIRGNGTKHVPTDIGLKAKSDLTKLKVESIKAPSLTTTFKIIL